MADLQPTASEVNSITIETELKQSYLDYAMSVIVGRALPDVRDGLKPVHRRVLYAMSELNNDWNRPYKKSARIVGDVIGKYHPHGDSAVYDTIVRMAQPFSMRYVLIDGQGNFGSVDGDAPAAMRYTEIRLSRLAHSLLEDLEKDTVDFVPNYDGSEHAPRVLPTRIPNLLVNGSSGIAVGMATNIPPHNLAEIIDACLALLDKPEITAEELREYIPGPDFPTSGFIYGTTGITEAYRTGRGRIILRARTHIEIDEKSNRQSIIVTELPYQVNKARLQERIAELVKEKKLEGIAGLRDESDKDGIRLVIELKRGEIPEVVLNNLFVQTQLQIAFGINMVALVEGQPRLLNLKQLLEAFLRHRYEIVTRRTSFELRKARERAHILEGLGIALVNIDPIINLIKQAPDPVQAKAQLLAQVWKPGIVLTMLERAGRATTHQEESGLSAEGYRLSVEQAQAILDLRLQRLTNLEQDKILSDYQQQLENIQNLLAILGSTERLKQVIREEFLGLRKEFADKRLTEIIAVEADFTDEDLIPNEEVVVTISYEGYAKSQALDFYQSQRRGGRGKLATSVKEEDFVKHLLIAQTHDTLLCFSSLGKVYWLKVYKIPQATRTSRGRPLVNLLPLAAEERISAILPVAAYREDLYVFMATAKGLVKKTRLADYSRPRSDGIIALDLLEGDEVVGVALTDGQKDILLITAGGRAIRFPEDAVRPIGRVARGVRGVRLREADRVISLMMAEASSEVLTATEAGYGKRTPIEAHRITGRGGQGVIAIKTSERNGKVIGALQVSAEDEVMLISQKGTLVRIPANEIRLAGRNSQGVRLIRLDEGDALVGLQRVYSQKDEE